MVGNNRKPSNHLTIQPSTIIVIVILLIAAYLRLNNISGYMTFLGDEGRDVLVVKRMIVDHKWTLLGPAASVGGFFLGPIYYYFMLPFLWAWRLDPTGPAVMVALFGTATVYLVYRAGRDMFNAQVGIIASVLYALSPVVIAYSRSSWNPNIVPFFSLLTIYLLWQYARTAMLRTIILVGISIGIGLQLHYLFLFLVPVAVVWTLIHDTAATRFRSWIVGALGFIVGYSPFLLFELRHGFPNTQFIARFIMTGKDTGLVGSTYSDIISDILYRLVGRLVLRLPQPEILQQVPMWQQGAWQWGINGILIVGITMLAISAIRAFPQQGLSKEAGIRWKQSSRLMLLWGGIVIALFGFYKRDIYDYYFGVVFAVPFFLTAIILDQIRRIRGLGTLLFGIIFLFLVWWNWQGRPFLYAPNNQLAQARSIASAAFEKAEGKPFNFALVTKFNSDHAYRYFFEIWGSPPVTIEPEFKDPARTSVTDQLIVLCEIPDCKPLGHPLWEIAGFGMATISGTWKTSFVTIHKLIHL